MGVYRSRLANPDLKWETTTEWNLGLDMGFLNNRILASVEFYHKVVSDLLNYKPLNAYQEITRVMANVGKHKVRVLSLQLIPKTSTHATLNGLQTSLSLPIKTVGRSVLPTGSLAFMNE